ncbi:MAG: biotin transporter BioY [Pseudomonadota bacterium]
MALNPATLTNAALAPTMVADRGLNRTVTNIALVVVGTAIMALAAKIQVPFFPVPMTLQTLAVFAISAAYGRNLAVATMLLYLAQGAMGIPVFAGPEAGIAYMMKGTAGYLVGFVVAAAIIGEAADRGLSQRPFTMFGVIVAADVVVFALGFAWLSTLIGAEKAWQFGVVPFVLGDLFKIAIATAAIALGWKVLKRD